MCEVNNLTRERSLYRYTIYIQLRSSLFLFPQTPNSFVLEKVEKKNVQKSLGEKKCNKRRLAQWISNFLFQFGTKNYAEDMTWKYISTKILLECTEKFFLKESIVNWCMNITKLNILVHLKYEYFLSKNGRLNTTYLVLTYVHIQLE